MSAAAWPFPRGSYLLLPIQGEPGESMLTTKVGRGPPMKRRLTSDPIGTWDGAVLLTGDQLQVFESWGKGILQGWTLAFSWIDPRADGIRDFGFREEPHWSPEVSGEWAGRLWRVEMRLEVLP